MPYASALHQGNQTSASVNPESLCALVLMDTAVLASWNVLLSPCVLLAIEGLVWCFLSVRALHSHVVPGNFVVSTYIQQLCVLSWHVVEHFSLRHGPPSPGWCQQALHHQHLTHLLLGLPDSSL